MAAKQNGHLALGLAWLFSFCVLAYLNVAGMLSVWPNLALAVVVGILVAVLASAMAYAAQKFQSLLAFALCALATVAAASLDGQAMATSLGGKNSAFVSASTGTTALEEQLADARARLAKARDAHLEMVGEAKASEARAASHEAEMARQTDPNQVSDPRPGAQWIAAREKRDKEAAAAASLYAKAEGLARDVETLQGKVQALEGESVSARTLAATEGETRFALLAIVEKWEHPKAALWGICASLWLLFETCTAFLAWQLGSDRAASPATRRRPAKRKAPAKKAPATKQAASGYGGPLIPPAAPEKPVRRAYGSPRAVRPEEN